MSADAPVVLFRADASPALGSGHVVRSLTLAMALAERGVASVFATRVGPGGLHERIRAAGHEVIALDDDPPLEALTATPWSASVQQRDLVQVRARGRARYDAVVVDHYGLDARWERGMRPTTGRVVALDDLADRAHDADVVVDHNWYGPHTAERYDGLVPPGCVQLLGPRYALLQPAYVHARAQRPPRAVPPRRVLVSFGGGDASGETEKVLEALLAPELAGLEVDVVVGRRRAVTPRLEAMVAERARTRLHVELPTLAQLLSVADLAVGASGSATWERMCLDVPAIVATTRSSQSGVTRALAEAGLTTWAGLQATTTPDRYRRLLLDAVGGDLPTPPALVDGLGAQRVVEALVPSPPSMLALRLAVLDDLPIFIGVDPGGADDGVGEDGSVVLDGPAAWRAGEARFVRDIADPAVALLVVTLRGVPVGRVRTRGPAETWVSLDRTVAGRGLHAQVAALRVGRGR